MPGWRSSTCCSTRSPSHASGSASSATGVGGPGAIPRSQLEQTLTVGLRERELAADALIPWDARALAKAARTGLPLAAAHPRGSYARSLARLLDSLFLPGAPVARHGKRLLALPARATTRASARR